MRGRHKEMQMHEKWHLKGRAQLVSCARVLLKYLSSFCITVNQNLLGSGCSTEITEMIFHPANQCLKTRRRQSDLTPREILLLDIPIVDFLSLPYFFYKSFCRSSLLFLSKKKPLNQTAIFHCSTKLNRFEARSDCLGVIPP